MAFLENNDIIASAVLTRQGRKILHSNNARFQITKFALFDYGVNYNLVNSDNDPDFDNITNLSVVEPSTNENSVDYSSKLIRFTSDELEQIAREAEQRYIPETEYRFETQVNGNTVLSLEHWKDNYTNISFALYHPTNKNFFLSDGFIIDFGEFYTKHGIVFDFIPLNPSAILGASAQQYWYNAEPSTKDTFGNDVNVVIGINDAHRPNNGTLVSNLTNDLNIPILTFQLKINQKYLKYIFSYMLGKGLGSITENVIIKNDDKDILPITDFFGMNKDYRNIQTKIPLTITF